MGYRRQVVHSFQQQDAPKSPVIWRTADADSNPLMLSDFRVYQPLWLPLRDLLVCWRAASYNRSDHRGNIIPI